MASPQDQRKSMIRPDLEQLAHLSASFAGGEFPRWRDVGKPYPGSRWCVVGGLDIF
jgi:hypothetical protein